MRTGEDGASVWLGDVAEIDMDAMIEREPVTEANADRAYDGPAISEEEHEVTLHAERPVVAKEAVPVERVRLDTQTVTEQETVNETVRKEQIELDEDSSTDLDARDDIDDQDAHESRG